MPTPDASYALFDRTSDARQSTIRTGLGYAEAVDLAQRHADSTGAAAYVFACARVGSVARRYRPLLRVDPTGAVTETGPALVLHPRTVSPLPDAPKPPTAGPSGSTNCRQIMRLPSMDVQEEWAVERERAWVFDAQRRRRRV
jgi:hypothetical protein